MNRLKKIIGKVQTLRVPKFTKNFYFITGILFFIWMLFFDTNDLISQYKWKKRKDRLEKEKTHYQELNNTLKQQITENDDVDNFEKLAREKHLLQKPQEDVFVIIEEEEK